MKINFQFSSFLLLEKWIKVMIRLKNINRVCNRICQFQIQFLRVSRLKAFIWERPNRKTWDSNLFIKSDREKLLWLRNRRLHVGGTVYTKSTRDSPGTSFHIQKGRTEHKYCGIVTWNSYKCEVRIWKEFQVSQEVCAVHKSKRRIFIISCKEKRVSDFPDSPNEVRQAKKGLTLGTVNATAVKIHIEQR
jgi:hypothetical protein